MYVDFHGLLTRITSGWKSTDSLKTEWQSSGQNAPGREWAAAMQLARIRSLSLGLRWRPL
jgi:hypothetical protein